ncbi:50S ribosomal protein L4 [Candidatus Aminicenantes bacterium AC-335-B20]|jgi:large subunit ribosomal protein L4|nr:50S ribosomal protein L4 [SCandidatus Aminicenantes bacterium Aminicenantia_JdfR_composite]MCP2598759.1 50S ribosomal protein L4 [Candidatus Aminicenantes bacterium AC-335-L06]MCP2599134.1 50S ribosomal protein L4 [Candidatus Aminicenantes bacterium AC-335-B20]MCP2605350.1 50S ribosomal protein L4 [Candidatus Aminicenantes bacterium AC-335-O07]MCP2617883.1 50S ribosomal protein L4 [Candidatus Aminicenantes bacterium AC-335-A11]MCP2619340.1 50S ribosomal protein L4 [Candidatus Aminicenantes 
MSTLEVVDVRKNKVGEMALPDEVFSYPVKEHLIYEAVINYRANQRRGTACTKTRGEVSGGGRKPWRQKGTGRARAGSIRSPLWRKGGVVFGPKPRDYSYQIPKKAKRNALKSALAMKLKENKIIIVDNLELDEPKTKKGLEIIKNLEIDSGLFIDTNKNKNLILAIRNIPKMKAVGWEDVNIYDVLLYDKIIFSKRGFDGLMERLK